MRAPTAGQDVTTVFGGTSNTFNLGHGTVCAQVSNDHAARLKPLMQTTMGTSTANHFFGTSHTQNHPPRASCNNPGFKQFASSSYNRTVLNYAAWFGTK